MSTPSNRLCTVPGCGRPHSARGFCHDHWKRWRNHGDPLGGGTVRGDVQGFVEAALAYASEDCLLWPFSINRGGYGQVQYKGDTYRAHNLICRLAHGDPPSIDHQAAHRCGKKSCVSPQHLRWTTRRTNSLDKILHGTNGKLTVVDVLAIREQQWRLVRDLAITYGVTTNAIRDVCLGKTWSSTALLDDVTVTEDV
jgi:hypothetical protein